LADIFIGYGMNSMSRSQNKAGRNKKPCSRYVLIKYGLSLQLSDAVIRKYFSFKGLDLYATIFSKAILIFVV